MANDINMFESVFFRVRRDDYGYDDLDFKPCLVITDSDGEVETVFADVLDDLVERIEEKVLQHFNEKQDWDLAIRDIESVVSETIEGNKNG